MSCREGFDPFGDRDAALVAHASHCPHCGDVLRVLGASRSAWKRGLERDQARAFFRERRLGHARPPARKAMTTLVFAVVVAALSGFALARRGEPRSVVPPAIPPPPSSIEAPRLAPRAVAPRSTAIDDPPPEPPPLESALPDETPPPQPRTTAPAETSRELFDHAVAKLDAGDRSGAEAAFRRVMDLPSTEPGLKSRATFRWAQLLLSRGDTRTPREPLYRLVRGPDAALGFDAALLLERCAPEERSRIWDAYLERTTDPALRERALGYRDREVHQ